MRNFYEIIKESLYFNKFEINDTICVEYSCPLESERDAICSQSDYIIHVLSGKKTWRTINGEWVMVAGDILYVKKGATLVHQNFDDDFCMLGFFVSDGLIQESVKELDLKKVLNSNTSVHQFTASPLTSNAYLDGFFQSMLTYFKGEERPQEALLKLKLKELLANIIYNRENSNLASYLKSIAENSQPSLTQIMEANFCYNLSLNEFAKLCHRSLSTFKRDFHNHYNTTPGKWLLSKRLDYSANLLLKNQSSITDIVYESGFEDTSHFSRAFKQKFGVPPSEYNKVLS